MLKHLPACDKPRTHAWASVRKSLQCELKCKEVKLTGNASSSAFIICLQPLKNGNHALDSVLTMFTEADLTRAHFFKQDVCRGASIHFPCIFRANNRNTPFWGTAAVLLATWNSTAIDIKASKPTTQQSSWVSFHKWLHLILEFTTWKLPVSQSLCEADRAELSTFSCGLLLLQNTCTTLPPVKVHENNSQVSFWNIMVSRTIWSNMLLPSQARLLRFHAELTLEIFMLKTITTTLRASGWVACRASGHAVYSQRHSQITCCQLLLLI